MDNEIDGQTQVATPDMEADPWAAAFAALEQQGKENSEEPANSAGDSTDGTDAAQAGGSSVPDSADAGDIAQNAGEPGGLGDDVGASGGEPAGDDRGLFVSLGEQELQQYRSDLEERVRNQAIEEIAREFVKRGVRNRNGVLGATIEDPDICKRDADGVPHFFNPETGREFTGDNPRRQTQEWIDDYNKELARVFNNACQKYEEHLMQEESPKLKVMEFAPKYEKLDDIRRGMFENVIEDYEIKDKSGKVIGYSCDLDKALALVDRQVAMIQSYAKQHKPQQQAAPTGPALDMKTSSGAVAGSSNEPPKSLEEAMLRIQEQQLAKLRNK